MKYESDHNNRDYLFNNRFNLLDKREGQKMRPSDGDAVLQIARRCENISKRGGDHSKEYHRIAQHLKKSAGHLKALERNGKT